MSVTSSLLQTERLWTRLFMVTSVLLSHHCHG